MKSPPAFARVSGRAKKKAFSLIELLTVMAVIGLMIGLATLPSGVLTATGLTASTRNFADFVNLCRSQAISKHTAVRVGIVVQSNKDKDAEFRKYSSWVWNQKSREFEQMTRWNTLPNDLIFEKSFPNHLRKSLHAQRDASSVRGSYVIRNRKNTFEAADAAGDLVRLAYFQFSPSGRVSAPGAELRNLILVLNPGRGGRKGRSENDNWAQINLDTLTGRYRVYRPE